MAITVEIQIACDDDTIPEQEELTRWVSRAFEATGRSEAGEVAVRVVDTQEMQELNRDFREKDKPTNVLSFPAGALEGMPSGSELPLGDIVVCAPVVRDEALDQGKALADHWAHMIVHGTLHLLGYDHETEPEALEMEGLETQILGDHGIANPYAETRSGN